MEQLIKDIFNFMSTREINIIFNNGCDFETDRLIIIAMEILGWLKLEYKRTLWNQQKKHIKLKPLQLNYNYPWCKQLKLIVEKDKR